MDSTPVLPVHRDTDLIALGPKICPLTESIALTSYPPSASFQPAPLFTARLRYRGILAACSTQAPEAIAKGTFSRERF